MCIPVPMQTYDVTISVLRQHPHKTAISGLSRKEASMQHSPGALPPTLISIDTCEGATQSCPGNHWQSFARSIDDPDR